MAQRGYAKSVTHTCQVIEMTSRHTTHVGRHRPFPPHHQLDTCRIHTRGAPS